MKLGIASLLILALLSQRTLALYDKGDYVTQLNTKNFKSEVLDTEQLVSVEFYAPWCGHCQRLAPEYKKAAENLKGLVKVAAVDCDDEMNKPLCGQYGIQGFPTIKVFKNKKSPSDYQGPRTAKSIVDSLLSSMPSFVKSIKSSPQSKRDITLEEFYATDNVTLPKSILFTNKLSTPPLYKSLSIDFKDQMLLGEVTKKESDAMGVNTFPTVVVIPVSGEAVKYEGAMNKDSLTEFFDKFVENSQRGKKASNEGATEKKKPFDPIPIEIKTQADLDRACLSLSTARTHICAVAILPSLSASDELDSAIVKSHSDAMSVLQNLKQKHSTDETLHFIWMDENKAEDIIKKFDLVRDFPTLLVIAPGKSRWRNFVGVFDVEGVDGFLGDIRGGRSKTYGYDWKVKVIEGNAKQKDEL